MIRQKISDFWEESGEKIIQLAGFILVAILAFEFGYWKGSKGSDDLLIIERPALSQEIGPKERNNDIMESDSQVSSNAPRVAKKSSQGITGKNGCAYVGSKNSDKFYPPDCSYAKKIKPENLVCFLSKEEALQKGRIESTSCQAKN